MGIGLGFENSQSLKNNNPKIDYYITTTENDTKPIQLIGTTSSYLFYLEKDNNHVQISPIRNIKLLEALSKEERKAMNKKQSSD